MTERDWGRSAVSDGLRAQMDRLPPPPPATQRQPRGATGLKPGGKQGGWVGRKISPELGQGGK